MGRCRGLESGWFRVHKPLGDQWKQGGRGSVGGRGDHSGKFLFSGVGADRKEWKPCRGCGWVTCWGGKGGGVESAVGAMCKEIHG